MELRGQSISDGIGIGPVRLYKNYSPSIEEEIIGYSEIKKELKRYLDARARSEEEIRSMLEGDSLSDEEKEIFGVHLAILDDQDVETAVEELISQKLYSAAYAVQSAYGVYEHLLQRSADSLFAERAFDITDVKNRLLRNIDLLPEVTVERLDGPCIIAAYDLLPSDTARLDKKNVIAIVTQSGGLTSHAAIIARSLGIPAVFGIEGLMELAETDAPAIVDGTNGILILSPGADELKTFSALKDKEDKQKEDASLFLTKEPLTKDGVRIDLSLNMNTVSPDELMNLENADSVGLFRTEFLFLGERSIPSEEEQYNVYSGLLEAAQGKPVTIRTADIGADKSLPWLSSYGTEYNSQLGLRGIRLCFREEEMFKTQLRAMLRASVHGRLRILLPMVTGIEEIIRAKALIKDTERELLAEGFRVSPYKIGIMIEIPSMAIIADLAADHVDFASIGTNDLIQYITASDRMNSLVSDSYQSHSPAVFRLIKHVSDAFKSRNKDITICGELAVDSICLPALIGLGVTGLSVSPSALAQIKKDLSGLEYSACREIAKKVCINTTCSENTEFLRSLR